MSELHVPAHPVRFVTAASLFDGHDASINIMRRILQRQGAEVIHLGHNRSVEEVVTAAVQEDVDGIAVSSYQGGHVEYFRYLIDRLREAGRSSIRVYGGGGGVIVPSEIAELEQYGVAHVFSPADGQRLGLAPMVNTMIAECDTVPAPTDLPSLGAVFAGDQRALARLITFIETGMAPPETLDEVRDRARDRDAPVLGITGTGGSGKSSLTDELLLRVRIDHEDKLRVAVLAIDPTRRQSGALLGDRIRMNSIRADVVFFRSLATRGSLREIPDCLDDVIAACKSAGYDLVIVETPGIGQGDAAIVSSADLSLYVMTPEFGAASQLEKIDMLELADLIAINKFDRIGAEDALRDVRRQVARNHERFDVAPDDLPVFGTIASRFNDDGVTRLYRAIATAPAMSALASTGGRFDAIARAASASEAIVPPARRRYLSEVAEAVRRYHDDTEQLSRAARHVQRLSETIAEVDASGSDSSVLAPLLDAAGRQLDDVSATLLAEWPEVAASYRDDRPDGVRTATETLSGTRVPRVALPRYDDHGELLRWLRSENLPGRFPFAAGVFPFKRENEDPTRMFAGEGGPARTNRRFHLLAEGQRTTRLSTAFDSVTLYGFDPDERPDIYGKVGNAGVSVATLDDMKTLFDGFDLTAESTSVSMTINGPAPAVLAMYFNAAIDQHPELEPAEVLRRVRGTVQADILKEDQGQNTCIFSTEFALRMMADVQEWFVTNQVRNFYSVSISGYHIAEAGANPISQLAFTLANGFTYVEAYLARGMHIDDFAPNLSFFFSNGMDPEYTVIGRVARRIWAIAMRDRYGANERAQKLKYHVQTSGRSLHAQEISFNDIRTTLQALCAVYDNCNSLHTNAYDEAITTPAEESVRRALAIQLIINREWGLVANENPLQGSFIVDELTALVEGAVLAEFDRISERGGVLGAMELGYQRGRIQDESMLYEQRKHDGTIPIVGVNTFVRGGAFVLGARARSPGPFDRRREAGPAGPAAPLPGAQPRESGGRPGAPSPRRVDGQQPLRRADAHRAELHARRDHRHPLRGRGSVPPQHVIHAVVACHGRRMVSAPRPLECTMANPVLSEKRFTATAAELEPGWAAPTRTDTGTGTPPPTTASGTATMSANGTFAKTFFLWVLLVAGGAFGWSQVTVNPVGTTSIPGWIFIPLLVALGFALACIFAPRTAPFTAPLYAIAEGVVLGAISRVYEEQWSGIVLQAVLATLAVFVVCLALYVSGAVKVTNKFIFVVITATAGIFFLYLVSFLLSIFGVDLSFWQEPSPLGIGISVVICFVAALNLFVDFEMIRRMVFTGAPKAMEWYGAFGITITIVWLYLEVLRLLSKLRS